jgi:hypothetical protein
MITGVESDGGMIYWQGKTEELGNKPVPVPLCPLQIPHGLNRARTRASAVKGRRLTAWAMARPMLYDTTYSVENDDQRVAYKIDHDEACSKAVPTAW